MPKIKTCTLFHACSDASLRFARDTKQPTVSSPRVIPGNQLSFRLPARRYDVDEDGRSIVVVVSQYLDKSPVLLANMRFNFQQLTPQDVVFASSAREQRKPAAYISYAQLKMLIILEILIIRRIIDTNT